MDWKESITIIRMDINKGKTYNRNSRRSKKDWEER